MISYRSLQTTAACCVVFVYTLVLYRFAILSWVVGAVVIAALLYIKKRQVITKTTGLTVIKQIPKNTPCLYGLLPAGTWVHFKPATFVTELSLVAVSGTATTPGGSILCYEVTITADLSKELAAGVHRRLNAAELPRTTVQGALETILAGIEKSTSISVLHTYHSVFSDPMLTKTTYSTLCNISLTLGNNKTVILDEVPYTALWHVQQ